MTLLDLVDTVVLIKTVFFKESEMTCVLDLIVQNVKSLIKDDKIYFIVHKELNYVDCVCNACRSDIFLGITTENFVTFKKFLLSHQSNKNHLPPLIPVSTSSDVKTISSNGNNNSEPSIRKKFLKKLSYFFTANHFKTIKKQLSVTFLNEFILHLRCDFCWKEVVMHFNCDLLTSFVDHFVVNHEPLCILPKSLDIFKSSKSSKNLNKDQLNFSSKKSIKFQDVSSEMHKKLLDSQKSGILNEFLLYFKKYRRLKSNQIEAVLNNCETSSNCILHRQKTLAGNSVSFSDCFNLKKSSLNLQDKKKSNLAPYGKLVMSRIFDLMNSVGGNLTKEQIYFVVNKRQSIDCICNICCCFIFKNVTKENFCSFEETLLSHISDDKHYNQLKLFIVRKNISDSISTNDVDFNDKFLSKISNYFTDNSYLIKSKLDVRLLKNNTVLVSCDFCTKEYVMDVNCDLKTSFVAHLKQPGHKKELKKICESVVKPKRSYLYRYELSDEKFFEILKNFRKHRFDFFLKLNETGDKKIFCVLCRRTLPYNCEQSLKRITKLIKYHINSVSHLICSRDSFKKLVKSNCVKQRFQYPAGFFLKETLTDCNSTESFSNKNKTKCLKKTFVNNSRKYYFKHFEVAGNKKHCGYLHYQNSQRNLCPEDVSNSQLICRYSVTALVKKDNKTDKFYSNRSKIKNRGKHWDKFNYQTSQRSLRRGNFSGEQLNGYSGSASLKKKTKRQGQRNRTDKWCSKVRREWRFCDFLEIHSRPYHKYLSIGESKSGILFTASFLRENENKTQLLIKSNFVKMKECFPKLPEISSDKKSCDSLGKQKVQRHLGQKNFGDMKQVLLISNRYLKYKQNLKYKSQNQGQVQTCLKQKNEKKIHGSTTEATKNKITLKKKVRSKRKKMKNVIEKYSRNDNFLPLNVDFTTRCQSSILKSKKLELKLQREKTFPYSKWMFFPKWQRINDFINAKLLKDKRNSKKYQKSEHLKTSKRCKEDFMILERRPVVARQLRKKFFLRYMKVIKKPHKFNFPALGKLELSRLDYRDSVKQNILFKKVQRKQILVQFKIVEKYINNYLNSCFKNHFIVSGEGSIDITFFRIINNYYGERNLFCLSCRLTLPFCCNIPLENLTYLSILHLENCLNRL